MDEDDVIVVEDSTTPEVDNSETVIEAPDAVVEASPTIIVEPAETGEDPVSEVVLEHVIEDAERLAALEAQVGAMVGQLAEVASTVEGLSFRTDMLNEVAANEALNLEAVEDALAETVAEDLDLDTDSDPDTPPSSAKRHWFFQSWKELRNKT